MERRSESGRVRSRAAFVVSFPTRQLTDGATVPALPRRNHDRLNIRPCATSPTGRVGLRTTPLFFSLPGRTSSMSASVNDTRRRLARVFGEGWRGRDVERAISVADANKMKIVLAAPDRRLLLVDPLSGEHFLFRPDGPRDEYTAREHVPEITAGEPVPDRFCDDPWEPIDRRWRSLVSADRIGEIEAA